jgi:hypothetical protein
MPGMAALVTWKVKLFVVNTDPTAKTKADHADTIGVSAKAGDHDGSTASARSTSRRPTAR